MGKRKIVAKQKQGGDDVNSTRIEGDRAARTKLVGIGGESQEGCFRAPGRWASNMDECLPLGVPALQLGAWVALPSRCLGFPIGVMRAGGGPTSSQAPGSTPESGPCKQEQDLTPDGAGWTLRGDRAFAAVRGGGQAQT